MTIGRMTRAGWAVLVVGAVAFVGCKRGSAANESAEASASAEPETSAAPATTTASAAAPPKTPERIAYEAVVAAPTLDGATKVAKPFMKDTRDKTSDGALLLASWAMRLGTWEDFHVAKNETSYAKLRKDADEERTKRLCVSGTLIQIEKAPWDTGKMYTGLLMAGGGNLFHFLAVGSTGELVQHNHAKFCGVATGLFDYANSGGGTGHAVEMVGMFDLPENKTPKAKEPDESPEPRQVAKPARAEPSPHANVVWPPPQPVAAPPPPAAAPPPMATPQTLEETIGGRKRRKR